MTAHAKPILPLHAADASIDTKPETKPETMHAITQSRYGAIDVLHFGTTTRPTPGDGEVLIQVQAAGLDRGTWHLMTGRPYLMRIMGFGFFGPKNQVAGLDLAGTVVALGANVTRFKIGDAVFGIGRGSFAQYACAREDKLTHKPSSLTFEQASVLAVSGLTALQAMSDAGPLQAATRVLIIGASGGVGTYAVQLALAAGAEVTGVCSTSKLDLVRTLGAHHVIDYTERDFADGAQRYDVILDIGGNTPLRRLRRALTDTGCLVFVGAENAGDWTGGFGRQLSAFALAPFVRQRFAMCMSKEHYVQLERLAELVQAGKVTPVIEHRYPLPQMADAMRELEAGRVRGKVVIAMG